MSIKGRLRPAATTASLALNSLMCGVRHQLSRRKSSLTKIGLAVSGCFIVVTASSFSNISVTLASQPWKSPWSSDVTAQISPARRPALHTDGYGLPSIDITGLRAGTPVLAPVDSTVIHSCIARGSDYHRAIKLRASNGQVYSLIHVKARQLRSTYKQGEQIGVVAADEPKDRSCAVSYGIHLHMGLPRIPFTIDGQTISRSIQPGTRLRSTNGNTVPSVATVVSKATGRALDPGGANGTEVYPHPSPNRGNPYHRWKFQQVGDFYLIISDATGRVLDGGGDNGTDVYPHPRPNPANPYHLWKLQKVGEYYLLTNKATGRALDAGGASGTDVYTHPRPNPANPYHLWRIS